MSVHKDNQTRDTMRVALAGSCDGLAELRGALEDHPELDLVWVGEDMKDAVGQLASERPSVVLFATANGSLPAKELALVREHTPAPIVLLASSDATGLLDEALDGDVADVLLLPQLPDNVVFAARKARKGADRPKAAAPKNGDGRVITVFAPKGGTGKSVISTSLATAFAKWEGKKTLLLDLDLQFGDAAIMLGSEPDRTIYDLVVAPGELDAEKLAGYTVRHPSGLDVLAAPLRPEDAELVTEPKVKSLLEVARSSYEVIVVDTSPFFHGPMLSTLDDSDELLLLCGLDVPTLKNVRLSMQTLELLSFPEDRINLVLNQAQPKRRLKKSEIEGALEHDVTFEIPWDGAVSAAVNRGNPAVLGAGSKFKGAIREISRALSSGNQPAKKRTSMGFRRSGKAAEAGSAEIASVGKA